jgi:hypothetical protein
MFAKAIDGWQPRTRGELGDAFPLLEEQNMPSTMTACTCSFDNACKYSGSRTDEREIEVTSVAQLGSSFFVTQFPDQVTSATVESPEPRYARQRAF